jgi:hypothetical protein
MIWVFFFLEYSWSFYLGISFLFCPPPLFAGTIVMKLEVLILPYSSLMFYPLLSLFPFVLFSLDDFFLSSNSLALFCSMFILLIGLSKIIHIWYCLFIFIVSVWLLLVSISLLKILHMHIVCIFQYIFLTYWKSLSVSSNVQIICMFHLWVIIFFKNRT